MQKKSYPDSLVPKYTFSEENQELLLKEDPIIKRMKKARNDKSKDLFRPHFHFVNPENTLNDPNGLCFWNGAWHLFYQVRPPEDQRLHWGHAVSSDLVHWRDLPYALYPGPENGCYSGTVLIENERAIAIYHGTEIGNMVAIAKDPLLLNWEKIEANPVIPFGNESEPPKPYGIFDPCIWEKNETYYALSAGIEENNFIGKHKATTYLFRSKDLVHWEYLHQFIDNEKFTLEGDDIACPYFLPIGEKYILLFFSHMTGGQYFLGEYDKINDKFIPHKHGLFNFGATFPGGVHAPSATNDEDGNVIVVLNMNPAKPTYKPDNYLKSFLDVEEDKKRFTESATNTQYDWDQLITLPRKLSLKNESEIFIEPVETIKSLRKHHSRLENINLEANKEFYLDHISGNTIELVLNIVPKPSALFEIFVLQSPNKEEFTKISFYYKRGLIYRAPFENDFRANRIMSTALSRPVNHESIVTIDTSNSSVLPDVVARPPEIAPVAVDGNRIEFQIFIDRSIIEVFINKTQCLAVRVYPGLNESVGCSMRSRNQDSHLISLDAWKMKNIYKE